MLVDAKICNYYLAEGELTLNGTLTLLAYREPVNGFNICEIAFLPENQFLPGIEFHVINDDLFILPADKEYGLSIYNDLELISEKENLDPLNIITIQDICIIHKIAKHLMEWKEVWKSTPILYN